MTQSPPRRRGPVRSTLPAGSLPLATAPLHDQVVRRLAAEILGGHYQPGELLPTEPALTAHFGVSRTVVREALRVLASKGLVRMEHGRGIRVRSEDDWLLLDPFLVQVRDGAGLTGALIDDLLEVRRIIEVEAVALAALRATDAELDAIEAALERMSAAGADPQKFLAADTDFHAEVARATHNRLLRSLHPPIAQLLQVSFAVAAAGRDPDESTERHRALYRALRNRDPDGAREAVGHLISEFARLFQEAAESDHARGGSRHP